MNREPKPKKDTPGLLERIRQRGEELQKRGRERIREGLRSEEEKRTA